MALTKANSGVLKQTVVSKTTTYTATATHQINGYIEVEIDGCDE